MIDLLTSRLSNEIAKYFAWKPGSHSLATDAMQQEWNQEVLYAFLPFLVIERVFCKALKKKVNVVILIKLAWQTEPCYSIFFAISFFQPFLLPMSQSILKNSNGENHPFSPYPRYSSTWDVLAFIKSKWTDNKNFSNKHIILKFTKLFALTSASRASFMHPLDIRFMFHSEENFFQFHKISKTMEKGQNTSNI